MHAIKPTPVLIVKGDGSGNYGVPQVDDKRLKRIWYHMLQLLEAQYITLTQFTYPGCFGNVQSIYRSLEWSQRYRPHAERNKCSQKIVSTKTGLVKCIAKSTLVSNFHTWRFLCGKAQKNETIIINVMQRYFIA